VPAERVEEKKGKKEKKDSLIGGEENARHAGAACQGSITFRILCTNLRVAKAVEGEKREEKKKKGRAAVFGEGTVPFRWSGVGEEKKKICPGSVNPHDEPALPPAF